MTARPVFRLPEPPSANAYWRHIVVKGQPRTLLSAAARRYRETVRAYCLVNKVRPITGRVIVGLQWDRAQKRGDLDNRIKQLLDALRGLAFHDDAQVTELHATMTDGGSGTVAVSIEPLELGA